MHIFVFVDDFLVIGDDETATLEGCRLFEGLLAELGLQWAPHKRRGPAQVMEFLGLFMCNVPSMRCIGLTESRETKLLGMIAEWMSMRPEAGRAPLWVAPVEMARLLGHLVFASQVVQGGRVAMQAMLSSFKGMVVDSGRRVAETEGR